MDELVKKIKDVLNNYTTAMDYDLFHDTIDELCAKGIAKGCYQDYGVLSDVLNVLTACESYIRNNSN